MADLDHPGGISQIQGRVLEEHLLLGLAHQPEELFRLGAGLAGGSPCPGDLPAIKAMSPGSRRRSTILAAPSRGT
jgi:hypothetical protein